MTRTYTATLFDCRGVSDADKRRAEELFCAAVESALGSQEQVAAAYAAYDAALSAHGELPLPDAATETERAAVARWEGAEHAGTKAAFEGWKRAPDAAHFEIQI